MLAETIQAEHSTRPRPSGRQNRSPRTQEFPLVSIQLMAAFGGAVLVGFALRNWDLRTSELKTDIVSRMVLDGIHPFSDYVKYLAVLFGAGVAVTFASMLPALSRWTSWKATRQNDETASNNLRTLRRGQSGMRRGVTIAAALLIGMWVLNRAATPKDITGPLEDTFHEGEHIAWQPTLDTSAKPLSEMMLTHGFGLDVAPMWIADGLGADNRLVLARLVLVAFEALSTLGAFWVLLEVIKASPVRHSPAVVTGAALALLMLLLEWNPTNRRDLVFLIQLALTLRMYRHAVAGERRMALWEAAVIGMSIPAAFLYTYDRAIHFVLVLTPFLLGSIAFSGTNRRQLAPATLAVVIGAAGAMLVLVATVGGSEIWSIVGQLRYWSETMKYIFGVSLFREGRRDIIVFSMAASAQVVAVGLLLRRWRAYGLRRAWHENAAVVLLLGAAIVHMRIVLDTSDMFHLEWAVIPSMLLAVVLPILGLGKDLTALGDASAHERQSWQRRTVAFGAIFLLAALASGSVTRLIADANPLRVSRSISYLGNAYRTTDSAIVKPDYRAAASFAAGRLSRSDCFYTLTSEAAWYYLVDRPTCSEFHQLINARTTTAQKAVIADLATKRPPIVLYDNGMWSNRLHGVTIYESNPLVVEYVLANYRPAAIIGNHWFWERSKRPWQFADGAFSRGSVNALPLQVAMKDTTRASGTIERDRFTRESAIFVTYGEGRNQRIAAIARDFDVGPERIDWTADLPVSAVPHGNQQLRFWLWEAQSFTLFPIGQPHTIRFGD